MGRMVTLWARRAEIGAEGQRRWVQGPAARTTSVAGMVVTWSVALSTYVTDFTNGSEGEI